MRLLTFFFLATTALAAPPPELVTALKNFRAEPPPGWSFTQTTVSAGESLVERCDTTRPEFDRWSLITKNGRRPTDEELRSYAEIRSRRSRAGTAPKVTDQIDLTSIALAHQTADRATYTARLVPGEKRDTTAAFLRVTIVFHSPTATIESFELANTEEFTPTLGVRVAEMKTAMIYTLPTDDTPALLQRVTTRVRGRAFWFKSLDADMTVTFADYAKVGRVVPNAPSQDSRPR